MLEELLKNLCLLSTVKRISYIDPYSGEGAYPRSKKSDQPSIPASKVKIWSEQQSVDGVYLGSPLIALQVLNSCRVPFTVSLSDKDVTTVEALKNSLINGFGNYKSQSLPEGSIVVQDEFDCSKLDLIFAPEPSSVNVVLLDPTRPIGYSAIIERSIECCRESHCNIVLMCWGLQKWQWPKRLLNESARTQAVYSDGKYPSIVHLLWFGELQKQLANVSHATTQGW